MTRRSTEPRRSIAARLGAFVDSCVYTVDPKKGNARFVARKRREFAEKSIERFGKLSADRDGGGRGGTGGFHSAEKSPDAHNWLTSRLSPDSALEYDRDEMILRADSARKNFELGTAHVEGRRIRVVGCGFTIDPDIDYEEVGQSEETVDKWNLTLRKNWERTACRLGKRGEEYWQLQQLCQEYWERRGEWFILVGDRFDAMAPTTLKVEVIHPDRVTNPPGIGAVSNGDSAPWLGDHYVRMGVQLDKGGDVLGYYVRDTHPGDDKTFKETWTYYPATYPNGLPRVIHHFHLIDEGQHRGFPRMQVGTPRLKNSQDADEAYLEKVFVESCLAAVVRTDLAIDDVMESHGVVQTADGKRVRDIVPGTFHYIGESDAIEFLNPSSPSSNFSPFMEHQGRMFAAGAGTPYEMLTGNWAGLAYNAARIIWNLDEAGVDVLQKGHVKTMLAIYAHFVTRMVVTGQVEIDSVAYRSAPWMYWAGRPIPPARASIDPAREDRNEMVLIEGGIKPHSDMVERKTGQPASSIYRRIFQNFKLMKLWEINTTMPNMGRDGDGENSPTQPGDKNQESSDANREETEAVVT